MIFVARDLGFGTGVLGLIFATGGIGSLVGAALAPRLGRRLGSVGAMFLGLSLLTLGRCSFHSHRRHVCRGRAVSRAPSDR